MSKETCFVVMPIGEQIIGNRTISETDLKNRYNDLIKEAIETARPNMDIVRADEVCAPGGISTDVYTRLMHSNFVVADITFPNPNVFYELGIRHACRTGTILIRAKDGPPTPFDIAGQRHIAYENTGTGLKLLADELRKKFDWFGEHHGIPDNDFQELASLTKYKFPMYVEMTLEAVDALTKSAVDIITEPELKELYLRQLKTGAIMNEADKEKFFLYLRGKPEVLQNFFKVAWVTRRGSL